MYLEHFGLDRFPFTIAPDPGFLFPSSGHQEAMAHLHYALTGHGGLICLTGEVGTGKTTLCRAFLNQLPDDVQTAYLFNPQLSPVELMRALCDELSVPYDSADSLQELYKNLNLALLEAYGKGKRIICVIDEAQSMPVPLLEQIRLLTNLETEQEKLLTLILVGQPELNSLLARHELRQLNQRITARYHLRHLDKLETRAYLKHRLQTAGCQASLFDSTVADLIQQASAGVPRLINSLADRALLGAYVTGADSVSAAVTQQAIKEVLGQVVSTQADLKASQTHSSVFTPAFAEPEKNRASTILAYSLVCLVAGFLIWLFWPSMQTLLSERLNERLANTFSSDDVGVEAAASSESVQLLKGLKEKTAPFATESESTHRSADPGVAVLASVLGFAAQNCDEVSAAGWACLRVSWTVDQLRPVQNQVAVENAQGDWVHLARFAGSNFQSPSLIIWQPPEGYSGLVKPGQRSGVVSWVRKVLGVNSQSWQVIGPSAGKSGNQAAMPADFYDPHLSNKIAEFQASNGLKADRLIGPQTLLYLQRLDAQQKEDSPSAEQAAVQGVSG